MKVIVYNICQGGGGRLSRLIALLRAEQADAIALVEANDRVNVALLAEALGMAFAFGEANCAYHMAWLSRLPIRAVRNHRDPGLAKTLLEIEVLDGDRTLHLFAAHLASRHEPPVPEDEVWIILDRLVALGDQPHLLVGDFNALLPDDPTGEPPPGVVPRGEASDGTPRLALRPLLDAGYLDCYRALHPLLPGYTYPTAHPWLRIDYLFAAQSLAARLRACDRIVGTAAERASDHFPVWADFR